MALLDKQMDRFTKQSLQELVTGVNGPCVSIYMPTERKGIETQQGPIRLKNLLNQVEAELHELGERTQDIEELLAPVHSLATGNQFWQYQSEGLAILLAPDLMATYRLPLPFQETALVNDRFYVKPLLPLLVGDGTFYLLTLNQGGVHLLQGSRFSLSEVELGDDVPKSLDEELRYDEFETHLQSHTMPGGGAGGRGRMFFHGQGSGGDETNAKEHVLRFLRQLDNGVCNVIESSTQPPLILAGVDSMRGLYRQVNQYKNLLELGIEQDPDPMSMTELHERAWAIVEPIFTAEQQTALDAYHHLAGTEDMRAVHTIEEIAPAAYFQRVDTLFMPSNTSIWGTFDPEANKISTQAERQPGDEDLLDFAAVHTLINGGSVYMIDAARLPSGATLAAILRY